MGEWVQISVRVDALTDRGALLAVVRDADGAEHPPRWVPLSAVRERLSDGLVDVIHIRRWLAEDRGWAPSTGGHGASAFYRAIAGVDPDQGHHHATVVINRMVARALGRWPTMLESVDAEDLCHADLGFEPGDR